MSSGLGGRFVAQSAASFADLAEDALAELKARYQVGERHPVPVEEIVRGEGGRVVRRFMIADASLSYPKRGRGFTIAVNSSHPEVRQRFSTGHELGHVMLERMSRDPGGKQAGRTCQVEPEVNHMDVERLCNRFAAGLLIPDEVVMWFADWGVLSIAALSEGAQRWAVSLPAFAWHVLEKTPGDGGLISLKWVTPEGRGGGSRLVVEWSVFPRNPGVFLKPGLPVVSTPVLREMLSCRDEESFPGVNMPLPGFIEERDVRALGTRGRLLLLVSPSATSR